MEGTKKPQLQVKKRQIWYRICCTSTNGIYIIQCAKCHTRRAVEKALKKEDQDQPTAVSEDLAVTGHSLNDLQMIPFVSTRNIFPSLPTPAETRYFLHRFFVHTKTTLFGQPWFSMKYLLEFLIQACISQTKIPRRRIEEKKKLHNAENILILNSLKKIY